MPSDPPCRNCNRRGAAFERAWCWDCLNQFMEWLHERKSLPLSPARQKDEQRMKDRGHKTEQEP